MTKKGKATGAQLQSINHIVVVMLENRSFDHTLGKRLTELFEVRNGGYSHTPAAH
jgi:phospholipase C